MAEKSLVNDVAVMETAWAVVGAAPAVVDDVLVDEELLHAATATIATTAMATTRPRLSEIFICSPLVGSG
jgi:hypothetical protein